MSDSQRLSDSQHLSGTVITIRLHGELSQGKVSDINFKSVFDQLYAQGAYFIMKNTAELTSQEFSEIKMSPRNPERDHQRTSSTDKVPSTRKRIRID